MFLSLLLRSTFGATSSWENDQDFTKIIITNAAAINTTTYCLVPIHVAATTTTAAAAATNKNAVDNTTTPPGQEQIGQTATTALDTTMRYAPSLLLLRRLLQLVRHFAVKAYNDADDIGHGRVAVQCYYHYPWWMTQPAKTI
jgi:hypothetical protein